HLAVLDFRLQDQDAAAGLERDAVLAGVAMVVEELGDTADAVAAHLGLAAVGVVHAHARVGLLGRADENEPVGADAEMPVADDAAQRGRVLGRRLADAIHVDVVVARAVHLGESHDWHSEPTGRHPWASYSHSMVAGGLLLTS